MIRKYKEADLNGLMDTWLSAFTLAHPFIADTFVEKVKKDMVDIYIPNTQTWVYVENEHVIGFIAMLKNEIGGLFVHPAKHSKGIGTKLVAFVDEIYDTLEVEVFKENRIGLPFYKKMGFVIFKEYFHEESGAEVLRMRKI